MPIPPCIIVYRFGGRNILCTETRVRVGVRSHPGITACRLARAVKAMAMQPRTRRDSIGSESVRTAPASASSDLHTICSRSIASAV